MTNWGWFMQWLRKEIVGHGKIIIISDQHLGIRTIFGQCTTVRSLCQIQQKSTKEGEERYIFQ
jgi:hypothetical protein